MAVNINIIKSAIQSSSSDLLLTAGANRFGMLNREHWPLLRKGSNVNEDKALAYIESYCDQINPGALVVNELADYLEISTWAHAFDGWRYLSQSANALLKASRAKALHLAYYAELRAAMCILACSGIAVLKGKHFSISAVGELAWFKGPTHEVAWAALSCWAEESNNALAVVESFNVDSFMGVEWLELCRTGHSLTDVAGHWLKNWSVDLPSATLDREARNEASYRPDLFGSAMNPLFERDIRTVLDASIASLHSEGGGFTQVQAVLVADLCKKSADFRFGTLEARDERFWRDGVRWLHAQKSMSLIEAKELVAYVRESRDSAAGRLLALTNPDRVGAYSVFSRAFFMLHLASAMAISHRNKMNLRAPGGRASWPDVIVQQYGYQSNVWGVNAASKDRSAIEADAEEAIDTIDNSFSPVPKVWCPKLYWRKNAADLNELASFERHFVSMAVSA